MTEMSREWNGWLERLSKVKKCSQLIKEKIREKTLRKPENNFEYVQMDYRVVSYGGSYHRPVFINTNPVGLAEMSYLDEVQELTLCLNDTEGSPMISEPQIFRSKVASLSNREVNFEIYENIIIIPNFTPGQ